MAEVIRNQTLHEMLIPGLVEALGIDTYLEFGTHENETIARVRCRRRIGVDRTARPMLNGVAGFNCYTDLSGFSLFNMTTQQFIELHAASLAPFDFVFIDADHNAQAVGFDFFGILPHVAPEGIIALHDTNPLQIADVDPGLCGDAWRFARSLVKRGFECITLPYHPGLTLVRNRTKWGPQ